MNKKRNLKLKIDKKTIMIAAAALVIILLAAGAIFLASQDQPEEEPSLEVLLKTKLTAYETDLRDSLGSIKSNADAADYLLAWAKNKQINAVKDSAGNVIYNISAAENVADAAPAAILCSFDSSDMEAHIEEIAVALTIAKNAQNNGQIKIIFLAENNGDKAGIQNLDFSLIGENTNVICLGNTASARVSDVTGGYEHIRITKKLSKAKPSYNKAYKVTLQNGPSSSIYGKYDASFNPIKVLGNVLANFKSTSLLFELSSFYGGSDINNSPSKAVMTVVINDSDTAKFERKMNNSIEKIYEKYKEDYPEIEYTFEETELPSRVIKKDDTDNLVSLMYTSFNGVYNRNDEGTITALTNIGRLSTKDNRLKIDIAVMCCDTIMLHEISEVYQTICGLCDVNFDVKEEYPVYDGSGQVQTIRLMESFEEDFLKFTGDEMMVKEDTAVLTNCTFLHESNRDLPIIFCGVTSKTKHKFAGAIVTWLDQSTEEEA